MAMDIRRGVSRETARRRRSGTIVGRPARRASTAVPANGLNDPTIMSGQVRYLERWIDTLASAGT